jgi:hypothetical protein
VAASAVPQSPQKRLPGGFSALHFGQFVSDAPQSPQKFLPARFSFLHFEQRINSPLAPRFAPHLLPCRRRDYTEVNLKEAVNTGIDSHASGPICTTWSTPARSRLLQAEISSKTRASANSAKVRIFATSLLEAISSALA